MRIFEFSYYSSPLGQPFQSIALFCVSCLCLYGAQHFYVTGMDFVSKAVETQGKVIAFTQRRDASAPIVEYFDKEKTRHTLTSSLYTSSPQYAVGDTVRVLYNLKNPTEAKINSFLHLWFFALLLGLLGLLFCIGSIIAWIFRHKIYNMAGYPELSGRKR